MTRSAHSLTAGVWDGQEREMSRIMGTWVRSFWDNYSCSVSGGEGECVRHSYKHDWKNLWWCCRRGFYIVPLRPFFIYSISFFLRPVGSNAHGTWGVAMCCCINPAGPFILDTPYFFFGQSLRLLFTTSRFSCVFWGIPSLLLCHVDMAKIWRTTCGLLSLGDGINRRRHQVSVGVRGYMYSWIVPESICLTVKSRCYNMKDETSVDLFALHLRTLDASTRLQFSSQ
jgi:hypothetical protein